MTDHTVPGVRLQATKFLEHIVLLFTADSVPVLAPGGKTISMQRLASLKTVLTPAAVSSCSKLSSENLGHLSNNASAVKCNNCTADMTKHE